MSELIAGRYRAVAPLPPIGGVVRELAIDQIADHRVAVARLSGGRHVDAVGQLLRSAQSCRHASLAPVLDVVIESDGSFVHVEAQADGPLLSGTAMLPLTSALLVAADISDAISALHAAGLTHGGLVSDAVVLDASGRPVVTGACLAGARALGEGVVLPSVSADLRALGTVLYRLVTAHDPAQPPASPASLSAAVEPALNGLILALLSDDPRRPPPPAGPVAERLRAMAGVALPPELMPPALPQPALPTTPRRGISDSALAMIAGGIIMLAIVLAVAIFNGGNSLGKDAPSSDAGSIPTFTLPPSDSLTLTVSQEEILPLPDVLTDTIAVDTFEIFTDTTSTDIVTVTTGG